MCTVHVYKCNSCVMRTVCVVLVMCNVGVVCTACHKGDECVIHTVCVQEDGVAQAWCVCGLC
jgi:hypothetical protein